MRYTRCVDLHCREGGSEGCLIFLPVRYPLHVCMTHLTGRGGCLYIIPVRYSLYIIPVRWHHPCKMRILQGSGGALASTHTRYPYILDIYLHQQKCSQSLVAQASTHTEHTCKECNDEKSQSWTVAREALQECVCFAVGAHIRLKARARLYIYGSVRLIARYT